MNPLTLWLDMLVRHIGYVICHWLVCQDFIQGDMAFDVELVIEWCKMDDAGKQGAIMQEPQISTVTVISSLN